MMTHWCATVSITIPIRDGAKGGRQSPVLALFITWKQQTEKELGVELSCRNQTLCGFGRREKSWRGCCGSAGRLSPLVGQPKSPFSFLFRQCEKRLKREKPGTWWPSCFRKKKKKTPPTVLTSDALTNQLLSAFARQPSFSCLFWLSQRTNKQQQQ